ncbi:MAG: 5-(carboxyamino)imidazole ribonucleotide mutase [Candidatus Symbiobacter sp.]|nr:5-(carboxyamino)imidazole ribonucleotide mutase [Candidatus Symbiobacter sp.]
MPKIAVIMGSQSDMPTMCQAVEMLERFALDVTCLIVSAHRTPHRLYEFAQSAEAQGYQAIIAGAGGAAHLPGMVAALTRIPVLGVPIQSEAMRGLDSLYSIVQMPAGIPVATFAIGKAGAINAALFAVAMLALNDPDLAAKLADYRQNQSDAVALQPSPNLAENLG